ncbi:hypothetical protein [Streptomyces sp. NBC_01176]|uniref:hypothetical protein n=1 Tax=Streptomyces sp. NBC_01176 TaxID=2903760 RepID=UPI00386A698C|nr:hypothetical protein OG199_18485 [Streptomyces sp. NBC_01176]
MKFRQFRIMCVVVIALAVTSCAAGDGDSEDSESSPKMNMQEAAERADGMVFDTLSSVDPSLHWTHDTSSSGDCTDFNNDSHGYGSVIRNAVVMTDVSEVRRGALLGVIERRWKSKGYKITNVDSDQEFPAIDAAIGDGFSASLLVGEKGQFYLRVQTPCVEKSEVSAPGRKGNGRDYYGHEIPRPNVHDSFWSSTHPLASTPSSDT